MPTHTHTHSIWSLFNWRHQTSSTFTINFDVTLFLLFLWTQKSERHGLDNFRSTLHDFRSWWQPTLYWLMSLFGSLHCWLCDLSLDLVEHWGLHSPPSCFLSLWSSFIWCSHFRLSDLWQQHLVIRPLSSQVSSNDANRLSSMHFCHLLIKREAAVVPWGKLKSQGRLIVVVVKVESVLLSKYKKHFSVA